jgi:hypothetical protein
MKFTYLEYSDAIGLFHGVIVQLICFLHQILFKGSNVFHSIVNARFIFDFFGFSFLVSILPIRLDRQEFRLLCTLVLLSLIILSISLIKFLRVGEVLSHFISQLFSFFLRKSDLVHQEETFFSQEIAFIDEHFPLFLNS